jgi:hypothetical protein
MFYHQSFVEFANLSGAVGVMSVLLVNSPHSW